MAYSTLDFYTDEPAGLGVPPYLGAYPRYIAGYLNEEVYYLTIDDLRQLLDWYIREQSKDETKEVKGIFIVNHYKDINDRKDPFTKKAIEFANNNNFILITTSE